MYKVPLSVAVDEYLSTMAARGLRPESRRTYAHALKALTTTLGDPLVCNLTAQHIERVFAAHADTWATSTRNQRLSHLRQFLRWCDSRGYRDPRRDVMAGWRGLKVPDRQQLRVPRSEWPRLFANAPSPIEDALLHIGLYCFLRASEVRTLTVGDVSLSTNELQIVRHKTSQRDVMPISQELGEALRSYLTWYAAKLADQGMALLPEHILIPPRDTSTSEWGRYIGELALGLNPEEPLVLLPTRMHSTIATSVKKILINSGYDYAAREEGGWGMHVLRRSGARALFDELADRGYDGSLRTVQAMLGHSNSAMTERYLGLTLDREQRNKLIGGHPMFRASTDNVVPMRDAR